jgi:hypothetical protein
MKHPDEARAKRIYGMIVGKVYPLWLAKVEKKGRTKDELDKVLRWQTGYTTKGLEMQFAKQSDFQTFFAKAPKPNPDRKLVTGMICGVRVEEIKDPVIREMRIADKLIDELAKGRPMEKILRKAE